MGAPDCCNSCGRMADYEGGRAPGVQMICSDCVPVHGATETQDDACERCGLHSSPDGHYTYGCHCDSPWTQDDPDPDCDSCERRIEYEGLHHRVSKLTIGGQHERRMAEHFRQLADRRLRGLKRMLSRLRISRGIAKGQQVNLDAANARIAELEDALWAYSEALDRLWEDGWRMSAELGRTIYLLDAANARIEELEAEVEHYRDLIAKSMVSLGGGVFDALPEKCARIASDSVGHRKRAEKAEAEVKRLGRQNDPNRNS